MAGVGLFAALPMARADGNTPFDYVNPFLGTDLHGHAFPGATTPFGLVQLSPDTHTGDWDGCSGYHYTDGSIMGFSHTHLSGTGCGGLGDILIMPTVGEQVFTVDGYKSTFSHENESATPGYYRVLLDKPHVTAELTATSRVGVHRYTFPASSQAHLVLDLIHGIQDDPQGGSLKLESQTQLSGHRVTNGWGGRRDVFFVMTLSKPISSLTIQKDGVILHGVSEAEGKIVANLNFETTTGEKIEVKVGISATSVEGARRNLLAEANGTSFDEVRSQAKTVWSSALNRVTVESKSPKILRTYYSNVYESFIHPNLFCDVDGAYRGTDHKVHSDPGFPSYSTFSLWDIYRAESPMLTIWAPEKVNGLVASLVDRFQKSGGKYTPVWPLWDNETWCMIGVHSAPVIVDAYSKGLLKMDPEQAYQAIKTTAMGNSGEMDQYDRLGWVPSARGRQATSKTIEYSVDDWCVAYMAEQLGHKEDAAYFYKRASNYRNVFDSRIGFMRGRKEDGSWRSPFSDIALVGDEYTEADAWQYAFAVQHDGPGLVSLYGGDKPFIEKMDHMFAMSSKVYTSIPDLSGMIGQYSQGDEQCHHVIYLYNFAGAPWKTQKWVRYAMETQYNDTPKGECGNVDCGQMSAWYALSGLGFYPVNPADGVYLLGSPVVDKATIKLGDKPFVIKAEDNSATNIYVQTATLNGQPLKRTYITHNEIKTGGELIFKMGPKPNLKWGNAVADRPKSGMPKGFQYGPLPQPSVDKLVTLSLPIRVACGVEDPVGAFVADPNQTEGSTNSTDVHVDTSAPGSAPEKVYQSERYGDDFKMQFSVPKGKPYTVRLHFAESFGDKAGERIANYSINGKLVLPNFDVYIAAGGPNKSVIKEFPGIYADAKGMITIRIQAAPNSPDKNAKISAVEILP